MSKYHEDRVKYYHVRRRRAKMILNFVFESKVVGYDATRILEWHVNLNERDCREPITSRAKK